MKGSEKIMVLLIGLTTVLSALCYVSSAMWNRVVLICIIGLVWISGQYRQWRWTGYMGLISFVIVSAHGFFLDIPSLWLLLSVVSALAAWDMNMFLLRIDRAGHVEKRSYLKKCHYKKLAVTACIGFILGALSLKLDFTITFGWLILLVMALVICMSRLIRILINRTA